MTAFVAASPLPSCGCPRAGEAEGFRAGRRATPYLNPGVTRMAESATKA